MVLHALSALQYLVCFFCFWLLEEKLQSETLFQAQAGDTNCWSELENEALGESIRSLFSHDKGSVLVTEDSLNLVIGSMFWWSFET